MVARVPLFLLTESNPLMSANHEEEKSCFDLKNIDNAFAQQSYAIFTDADCHFVIFTASTNGHVICFNSGFPFRTECIFSSLLMNEMNS